MKDDFLKQLHKERQFITNQNNEIIQFILDLCLKNIKMLNSSAITSFIYDVPVFLPGFPLYKIDEISIAVNKKLKKIGLKTLYIEPNKIYISWKKI